MKSPFYVVEDFVSPLMCEDLVDIANFTVPDVDPDGRPLVTIRTHDNIQQALYERFYSLIPSLEQYYGFTYKGMEQINVEWLPEGSTLSPHAENSSYVRSKWLRTKHRDFTGVLFMSDYQKSPSFDDEFEVYGGKLEFPQHQFGFNPTRGTLIVFPSDPHFINLSSTVMAGNLYQARFQIASEPLFLYDSTQYKGNFKTWFK